MCKKNDPMIFGLGLLTGLVGGILAGVLYAPKSGEESRNQVKETVCHFIETQSPNVKEAKKQALESMDLVKYKLEKQFRRLSNMLKSKKMAKAKELEETNEYDFN